MSYIDDIPMQSNKRSIERSHAQSFDDISRKVDQMIQMYTRLSEAVKRGAIEEIVKDSVRKSIDGNMRKSRNMFIASLFVKDDESQGPLYLNRESLHQNFKEDLLHLASSLFTL